MTRAILAELRANFFEWQQMLLGIALGIAVMGGWNVYQGMGARLIMHNDPVPLYIHGIDIVGHSLQQRTRPYCDGVVVFRRLVRYYPGTQKVREVKAIREQMPMNPDLGDQDFHPHFTLYTPADGNDWYMTTETHESCSIEDIIFGSHPETKRARVIVDPNGTGTTD